MSRVFILKTNSKPLNPVNSGEARRSINQGTAPSFWRYSSLNTDILNTEVKNCNVEPLGLKIDLGSKITGLVMVGTQTGEVISGD